MWLFFFSISLVFIPTSSIVEPQVFTNKEFPSPYTGSLTRVRTQYVVPDGFGTVILFRQFLLSAKDCIFICSLKNSSNCDNLCGDAFDHRSMKKALAVSDSAVITLTSTGPPDNLFHSGVYGLIKAFDISNPRISGCNETINLLPNSPYFLVSPNYPNSMSISDSCVLLFQSSRSIRLAVYFLSTSSALDRPFKIIGRDPDGNWNNQTYSGKRINDGDPFGLYYSQSVSISYQFTEGHSPYQRGFYIIVDEYDEVPKTSIGCLNTGNLTLSSSEPISIQTSSFGHSSYRPFSDCLYQILNPSENHLILINLQYESEKCCDLMDFDGIGVPPFSGGTYQGSQYEYWNFAHSNFITMHFQSDGVIDGPGFFGSFYDVDCSCGDSQIMLTPVSTHLLSIPDVSSKSPSYCPSLNCSWTINFANNFDLHITFDSISLRMPSTGTDSLSINDNFGTNYKQTTSVNLPPESLVITSGPITTFFTSSTADSFLPSQMGTGFSMKMELYKKEIIRTSILFTDSMAFQDISTGAFGSHKNGTYEFLVVARDESRKVTIHFFSTTDQRANIDIFNGKEPDNEAKIDRAFLSNISEEGIPTTFTSTGSSVLIRIRANNDYPNNLPDFQAMVTDLAYDELTTYTTSTKDVIMKLSSKSRYTILHATDVNYDWQLTMSLKLSSTTSNFEVYKGLTESSTHLISRTSIYQLPEIIFDRYIVIKNLNLSDLYCEYSWSVLAGELIPLTFSSKDVGFIATSDYLPYLTPQQSHQQISFDMTDQEQLGIHLEFLKSSNMGFGVIQVEQFGKLIHTENFNGSNGSFHIEKCGTKLIVQYKSPAGLNNGLYIRYGAGSLQCKGISRISLIIIYLIAIYNLI